MKNLISALMLMALTTGGVMATEAQSLAATRGHATKARHSMVSSKRGKSAKKGVKGKRASRKGSRKIAGKTTTRKSRMPVAHKASKKSVGKVVRVRKSHARKAKPVDPATIGGGNPLPVSQ